MTIQKSNRSATLVAVKPGTAVVVFVLLATCFASAQAQVPTAKSQATPSSADESAQSVDATAGIPTFYAHAQQVIVAVEVWDKSTKRGQHSWVGDEPLRPLEKDFLESLPPVVRGLKSDAFHLFDNGVEQSINSFQEADFPAVEMTNHWYFTPTTDGTWGTFQPFNDVDFPLASYLIGYVPTIGPSECHTIRVVVEGLEAQVNRHGYCALKDSGLADIDAVAGKKLGEKMRVFANSTAHGSIKVSMQPFAFWSSGTLRLAREASPTGGPADQPETDLTYVVEVHDSKAPAALQIAVGFKFPELAWYFPCQKDAAVYVLGIIYKRNGDIAGQFADSFSCLTPLTWLMQASQDSGVLLPSWFSSQINLPPGDYDLRVVVSDGHDFGRARMPLRVESFDTRRLMMSDIAVGAVLRGAAWVLRDAASVAPAPVVPSPLVSKDTQFFPDANNRARLGKHRPLFLYFEVYEPLLENEKPTVYYRVRITDLRTSALVINTGPMSAADWVIPGNAVIPIGLKLATEKLGAGSYRLEIQASDSAGRQSEWRQAAFAIK